MGCHWEKFMSEPATGFQGVVLSSGGADGAYAVGVLKALLNGASPVTGYLPLDPKVFVGNSIGGLNSALLVSHLEDGPEAAVSYLEHVWLDEIAQGAQGCGNGTYRVRLNPAIVFDPACYANTPLRTFTNIASDTLFLAQDSLARTLDFATSGGGWAQRGLRLVNLGSFISAEPLHRLINQTIRFDKIRSSDAALRVMATNWTRGGLDAFSNADLTDELGPRIIQASAAIPGFFPPVTVGEYVYVDAAVLGYATLAPAINAGADTLHIIYLDPDISAISIETLQSTLDTLYRTFTIQWADNLDDSVRAVDRINRQVEALEQTIREGMLTESLAESLIRRTLPSGRITFDPNKKLLGLRKISLHRYHPKDDLFGPLGLLNLNRGRLESLIARGFNDTVAHDCTASGCVIEPSPAKDQDAD
jgi:predicted acylesterase/phospholipase RssA